MTAVPGEFRGRWRRRLIGAPIPNSHAHHERLTPFLGLPVFSSDPLSSVAYATEAIILILIGLSTAALQYQIWISLAIVGLIAFVAIAYRQTVRAYPGGGGSYIVATVNLGKRPGLVAASALLIDYVLTVAVSVAAGVAAILSAFPMLRQTVPDAPVTLSILCIAFVAFANLRGLRESGTLFAVPTYGFILVMGALIVWGIMRIGATPAMPVHVESNLIGHAAGTAHWFLLLRAFSAGCTALTGIEAVSNGVPAFRAPESSNAAKVLTAMALILSFLFLGLGYIALHLPEHFAAFRIYESSDPRYLTLTAQVAAFAFGASSPGFYSVQVFVALILILAANTAFADFPRLASLIARDGYLPHSLSRLGDRLVFHNGIVVLSIASAGLIFLFGGHLDGLLPLYAVGVFTAFSLSQYGMVVHWFRKRGFGWRPKAAVNLVGASLCSLVLVIVGVTKFAEGAWLVIVLIPLLCGMFLGIRHRYEAIAHQLSLDGWEDQGEVEHISILLVPRVNRGILSALRYARQLRGECHAVHVMLNEHAVFGLLRAWDERVPDMTLEVLHSPYRSLIEPVTEHVDQLRRNHPRAVITVLVAEAVSVRWWHRLLQENVAHQLKVALARRPGVVVANPRYFIQ